MPSLSAKQFLSGTIVLAAMLMTSLTQPTDDDDSQSAIEKSSCDAVDHVTEQLAGVSAQLAGLHDDVSAIRQAMESTTNLAPPPRAPPTNHSSHGKFQLQVRNTMTEECSYTHLVSSHLN